MKLTGRSLLLPLALWALGLLFAYHPTLLSGFARMQTDLGDTRFNGYVLEHTWRWLLRAPGHRDLWSPPIFYPQPNTGAYSDSLLTVAPFYWIWRAVGFAPDTSLQLWMLTVSSLTFLAAHWLLRRRLAAAPAGAALGAFLFAFGSSRVAQTGHQQLIPHFYTLLAVEALFVLFAPGASPGAARIWGAALLFGAAVAAQFYASFYFGWFLAMGLAVAAGWALLFRDTRAAALAGARQHLVPLLLSLTLCAALLRPLLLHYVSAAGDVPPRHFIDAYRTMPRPASWLFMGRDSWLYGWAADAEPFRRLSFAHEQQIGIGLLTPALALWGLFRERRRPFVRLLLAISATAIAYTLVLATSPYLTALHFYTVPGAYAIRVVCRVGLPLLLPAAVGLALGAERLRAGRRGVVLALAAAFCLLEQGRTTPFFDKRAARDRVAALARRVEPHCRAFFITPERGYTSRHHLDAMWVELATGVPTINGYSGNWPRTWPFVHRPIFTPQDRQAVAADLDRWILRHRLDPRGVCWIRVPGEE